METNHTPRSPDAASADAEVSPFPSAERERDAAPGSAPPAAPPAADAAPGQVKRIGWFEGHLPDIVDPLVPSQPDNAFTQTRRLRADGWTPEKMRLFFQAFAECGTMVEACEVVGMSARSVYNLRDRDPLFAAGLEAARVKARRPLADEAYSRARNGVVERIYKDGVVVAERHRYDNRLTMAVLARLDARIDRAEERGGAHLGLVANWDAYLAALGEDRRDDAAAFLAAPAALPPAVAEPDLDIHAGDRELRELRLGAGHELEEGDDEDCHDVWEAEGRWWTDYPPPSYFEGDEEGEYGDYGYRRTLTPTEQSLIDAESADDRAEHRARGEAQRDTYFGFDAELEGLQPEVPKPSCPGPAEA